MSRVAISAVAITETGYNLTDSASFTTMGTGVGNGVEITYDPGYILVLKNATGGNAVYTFKVPQPAAFAAKGITVPDVDVTVATAKSWLYPLAGIFRQTDGKVYVDCDVAANILVLSK
jgi:hypothetical protein